MQNGKNLGKRKDCALTQPVYFEIITSDDDRYHRACNLREAAGTTFRLVARCPYRVVYEDHRFHMRMGTTLGESLVASKVAEMYAQNVRAGAESEPHMTAMIEQCLPV